MSEPIERLAAIAFKTDWPQDKWERFKAGDHARQRYEKMAEAVLSALHLSPDAAAGLADGSWVAVPREPVAWLHRLTMETGDTVTKYEEEGLDPQDVWGIPGEDYSPEYRAEVFPLFASQQNGEK